MLKRVLFGVRLNWENSVCKQYDSQLLQTCMPILNFLLLDICKWM